MFSSLKSRLILLFLTFITIGIFISLLIGSYLSQNVIEGALASQRGLVYRVDTSAELAGLYDIPTYDADNLVSLNDEMISKIENVKVTMTLTIVIIFLMLSIVFIILFNTIYEKSIRPLTNVDKSKVTEFKKIKDNMDSYDSMIIESEAEINRINNYISHELKNSLAVLQGKIDSNNNDAVDYIQEISHQVEDINALLTNNIENLTEVDMLLLCAEVIDSFTTDVHLEFGDEDGYFVRGNQVLLKRVIFNLVENAFKYGANNVWIDVKSIEQSVIVEVSNDGDKINVRDIDKLFKYKYRASNLKVDGHGIGLSLVQNIIELLDGSVYVESNNGKTIFYISLPALNE